MDPRQIGPIAIVVDSSGRPVLNERGEPIGVYRQEVSARQRAENARRGRGRNIVWSSNSSGGNDYPFSRGAVVERFQRQACVDGVIGPGFLLTAYGREKVVQCAHRPAVIEPPDPPAPGALNARERRRAARALAAGAAAGAIAEARAEDERLARWGPAPPPAQPGAGAAPGGLAPGPGSEEPPGAREPTWTDRELLDRLSESPAERAARERRTARTERRIARERALDIFLAPILDRARAQTEREAKARADQRARARARK